ncbi:uncharacterized protein N7515_009070 [Penicillium bovifimosum]|uniref:Uncharacterized protein n=1 Tax=Penicillium bovifimosum TaxID=126998 RepID=A0A9W9GJP7_9EURO|nr:uncharacterized protein N7515_009070 [Penicillium bovifimosum]KAJ5121109.1 hypothetical protein N7515_009070 [Penicillium bovifimosum]
MAALDRRHRVAAKMERVWEYMDPEKSESEIYKIPTEWIYSEYPRPCDVKEGVTQTSDLKGEDFTEYRERVALYKDGQVLGEATVAAISRMKRYIRQCLHPDWHGILSGLSSPYDQLVRLKQQFAPRRNTRVQDLRNDLLRRATRVEELRNDWRRMIDSPMNKTSLQRWLKNWHNLYDKAKAAGVPDVCYTSSQYPPDSMAIRDFLRAVQAQDPYFANMWRQRLTDWEDLWRSKATTESWTPPPVADRNAMDFHRVVSHYGDYRHVQSQTLGGGSSMASTTTLKGKPSGNRNKSMRCLCGGKGHEWRYCREVNWTLRSPNFKTTASKMMVIEENLKKASPQVQEEVAAIMMTDPVGVLRM